MNYIDLFSGIGGFALGAYWADMKFANHYFSEVEPYAVKLYQQRFPDAIPLGDITKHKEWNIEPGEYIVSGGFPCQPYSGAGKQRGKGDDRDLWPAMFSVIEKFKPTWVLGENVTDIDGMALDDVLSDLECRGYETAPPLEIPAASVGAKHKRYRVWILAYAESQRYRGRVREECDLRQWGMVKTEQERSPAWGEAERCLVHDVWSQASAPRILRSDYGLSDWIHRLKGIGNAIQPQIAELLFRQIKGFYRGTV